ncbi:HAD family hydrolase [Arenicella xantha]|uniref:HAD superfamily hydrolase (TIGR01509 family) n=1 Tax=Arenicella xantha TaxID=644221 RepID=A0A395JLG7_9GAMM|nr:HAD family phosphatase [Arenicella xantha]RBP51265.1 HAD superfamily hydrolase (TIGR01509 family) [Arenicella xantha]
MKTPALIFDHDGTLVDSELLHFECWREVMAEYDVIVSEQEYIRDHNGIPTLRNAEVFIETYSLSLEPAQLCAIKQSLFTTRSLATPSPLMPTVLKTLQAASAAGYPMAIATGAERADIERSMSAHQLAHYFTTTATRSEVTLGKPAPDVYLLACERLQVEPARGVAFEDTAAGVMSAKAAGLICIAIPNRFSMHQDLSQADAQCDCLYAAYQLAPQLMDSSP